MENFFVCGLSGSGKDTVSNHLVENHNFIKIRLAKTIKQIICEKYNVTFDELEELKRIDKRFRELHHEVSEWLDVQSTYNRINQIIARTAMDFEILPPNIRNRQMIICDVRSYNESKMLLDAGFVGIFLSKQSNEYSSANHYTEQNMFKNGELFAIKEYWPKNQVNVIVNDSLTNFYDIDFQTDGKPDSLLGVVDIIMYRNNKK